MITQEDFDKLKQSDRIELLLRENRLEKLKEDSHFDWIGMVWMFFAIIGFITLVALQLKMLGYEESYINLIESSMKVFIIAGVFAVFGFLLNWISRIYIFPKWDKKLESDFFNFKTEIKNKK